MYLVFTRMPDESYCMRLRSLLLYLCYVFQALINSLACWLLWTLSIMKEEADRYGHETRGRTTITAYQLNAHVYRKTKLAVPAPCNCGTSAHRAFKLMESRAIKWIPSSSSTSSSSWRKQNIHPEKRCGQKQSSYRYTKLYCRKEELDKTATFVLQTGLPVWRRSWRSD